MQVTDADKAAINRLLAELEGWYEGEPDACGKTIWYCPEGNNALAMSPTCPNFFTDPAAADRLLAWLILRGFYIDIRFNKRGTHLSINDGLLGSDADDWKAALALACVERGKFCPACKGVLGDVGHPETPYAQWVCRNCKISIVKPLNWRVRKKLEGNTNTEGAGR